MKNKTVHSVTENRQLLAKRKVSLKTQYDKTDIDMNIRVYNVFA